MTRARLAAALLFSTLTLAAAPPGPVLPRNKAERVEALPDEERRWLTDFVAPIILPEEEAAYLELQDADQRARFREAFWSRREKAGLTFPLGPGYRGRYERLRALADSTYDGVREDAGRMIVRHGEPASIDTLEACRTAFRDLEIWTYAGAGWPGTRRFFFYRVSTGAPRRLFRYGTPDSELLSPGSCRKSMGDLGRACTRDPRRTPDPCAPSDCAETCRVWELYTEIRTLQGSASGGESESASLLEAPRVSTEDLVAFRSPAAGPTAAPVPANPSPVSSPSPAPAPAAASASSSSSTPGRTPKLSKSEKAAKMRDLSGDDRYWLTEYVAPIIQPDEENLFLVLPAGYPRTMFREEFWKRRERDGLPQPFGPGYRLRYEQLLAIADSDYDGRFGDAGRLVVRRGEPAGLQEFKDCSEVYRQAEIWIYPPDTAAGRELHFLFYRPSFGAPRRLWLPGDNEIFQTASCIGSFDQACARTGSGAPPQAAGVPCVGRSTPRSCDSACYVSRIADEIRSRGTPAIAAAANFAPPISTEGADALWQRLATSSDPNAKKIGVEGPSSSAAAAPAAPAASRPSASAAEPEPEAWTQEVIRDRIIALPKKYRDFLDVAAPIMSEAELVTFLRAKPAERDAFIRKFWRQHGKKG